MKQINVGIWLLAVLALGALLSSTVLVGQQWQGSWGVLFESVSVMVQSLSLDELAVALRLIPTMSVAILAGGLLGMASTLLQTLAKNPLASDSTLAVGSGAQMTLLLATLFVPSLGAMGNFWVGFVGAMGSMGLVFLLAMPSKLNPVVLVLSGLVVNILLSAVASVLLLFYSQLTMGVVVWGSGLLTQTGWQGSWILLGTLVAMVGLIVPIYKGLVVMQLDDAQAKSLGVPVAKLRLYLTVVVAGVLSVLVGQLGMIGFVGLGASTLANRLPIQKLWQRLVASFVFGALILWITANAVALWLPDSFVGAGALTAVLGAPIIIYLVLTLPKQAGSDLVLPFVGKKTVKVIWLLLALAVLVGLAQVVTPYVAGLGQSMQMAFGFNAHHELITHFRLPRTLTALSAGVMLSVAGVTLQSLTRNPMASPEVLGLSSATAMGVVLGFLWLPSLGLPSTPVYLFGFGLLSAGVALAVMLFMAMRVPSSHLLLVGIAVSALMGAVMSVVKVSNDPRLFAVLNFLSGSTYHATLSSTLVYMLVALLGLLVAVCCAKPLTLMGFGQDIAKGRGVAVRPVNLILLSLVAVLSVVATFAVGPLSFVGLMTPHLALMLGARTLQSRIIMSALLGAILMVLSDWVGRYVIFPYEIPAGTIASLVGGAYFVLLMRKLR